MRMFQLAFGILLTGQIFGQEAQTKIAYSLTPQLSGFGSTEDFAKSNLGFGIKAEAVYKLNLSDRLHFFLGPSFQSAEVANRANNLRWPDDNQNGQWIPGRSYEEYSASFISIGATTGLHFALPGNNSKWLVHGGTSVRYVLDYRDKLTINESGFIREYTSEPLVTEINKVQFFVDFGISYSLRVSEKRRLSIGPEIEYGIINFLKSAEPTLVWTYHPAYPVFFGLNVMIH